VPELENLLFVLVIFVGAFGYMMYRHNAERQARERYGTNTMIESRIQMPEETNR